MIIWISNFSTINILLKVLHNIENCGILLLPNNLNIRSYRCIFFMEIVCLFCYTINELILVKMQLPFDCVVSPMLRIDCLATIGVCVFRCVDFGWRTFYFTGDFYERKMDKTFGGVGVFDAWRGCDRLWAFWWR